MKIRKELWFGFALMAVILVAIAIFLPWGNLTNGHLGLLMLALIVVAIIGLLAALLVPRLTANVGQSKIQTAKAYLAQLTQSVEQFRLAVGRYPTEDEWVKNCLIVKPQNVQTWTGPYWDKRELPKDPWNQPYQYLNPGVKGEIDVYSFGADGQPGGEGRDADVGSWQ